MQQGDNMERIFKLKTSMEKDNWHAKFILGSSDFFEGLVYDDKENVLDIMNGCYDKSFGGCTFTLVKMGYKYVLYQEKVEEIEYPKNILNKKQNLEAACYDIYGNYSTAEFTMEPSDESKANEISELKSAINDCKIKIYSNGDRIRRIK